MMIREMMIWNENYLGPDRRYRFRRLVGGTRSGMERRHVSLAGGVMGGHIRGNRCGEPRRFGAPRRIREDRRCQ